MNLRFARVTDAQALSAIYRPYVEETAVTFLYTALSPADFEKKIADLQGDLPFLLCEEAGETVGYAYASHWRYGDAYQWDVELSVYVAKGFSGRGIGKRLYSALLQVLRAQGYKNAYGGITLPNEKSLALHRSFGFEEIGIFKKTGYKCGAWQDVIWLGKSLGNYPENPERPCPLAAVDSKTIERILESATDLSGVFQ